MAGLRIKILIFVCLSQLLIYHEAYSEATDKSRRPEKLILSLSQPKEAPASIAFKLMYEEVSIRLGIPIELKYLPAIRASRYSDSGVVDGEAGRVAVYHRTHPNLVIVREQITEVVFSAYAVKPSIRLQGWKSLENKDLKVEYIRGTMLPGLMLSRFVKKENVSVVGNRIQGLKKLVTGRTDVFIEPAILIDALLKLPEFKDMKIYKAGDMQRIAVHSFLHKKHKAFEPELSAIIKAIKAEGIIKRNIRTLLGV